MYRSWDRRPTGTGASHIGHELTAVAAGLPAAPYGTCPLGQGDTCPPANDSTSLMGRTYPSTTVAFPRAPLTLPIPPPSAASRRPTSLCLRAGIRASVNTMYAFLPPLAHALLVIMLQIGRPLPQRAQVGALAVPPLPSAPSIPFSKTPILISWMRRRQ